MIAARALTPFLEGYWTTMQLTEEQQQLVEAAHGQPVEFVDPRSQRRYVLVPAELYYRPGPGLPAEEVPRSALPPEVARGEPLRIKLRELPMPPEVAERARRYCKQLGLWRSKYVQGVEDEAKLSYYFGGQTVVTLRSKAGPIIVAAGQVDSDQFGRQLDALPPEERRQVSYNFPTVWNDTVSELRTPFDSHDDPTPPG